MFRNMRRIKQMLSVDETQALLKHGRTCVMACLGDDGYPYSVPVNYVYINNSIYFHCSTEGHKIDAVKRCSKVSLCIIDYEENAPEHFTTLYKSVIIFGQARIVQTDDERLLAIRTLCSQFSPDEEISRRDEIIDKQLKNLNIVAVDIEHITGKQAIRLVPSE